MKSPVRLLTLAFVLALGGPLLRLAEAGDVPPVVAISSTLTRSSERVGQLSVTAEIASGFHIYALSQPRPFLATRIAVAESPAVRVTGTFTPSRPPKIVKHTALGVELHEYEERITWTVPVEFSSAPTAELVVRGTVFAQACQEDRCLAPMTYEFKAPLCTDPAPPSGRRGQGAAIGSADASKSIAVAPPVPTDAGARTEARQQTDRGSSSGSFSVDQIEFAAAESGSYSIWAILPLAFVAGFLLNLMPCVLPVVGLKLLSFVQQSNDSRRRVLLLNVAYSAGLMSVMLVLATFAVFAGLGWGEQFSSTSFSVTLAAIVFAFGLNFLGIWEISVPGFVGAAGGPASDEGHGGAFSKGVLSTLLATPCSGPFLGSALAWGIAQPAYLTYVVFAFVGLGMASPYLLVGLFPRLIRLLPRPGYWMVTFKQIMGFVLMATVVYLLSFIENGVVALRADKTKPAPEVDETLRRLGNKAASIPFYAIFPSNASRKPIVLDGLLTTPQPIVQALRKAGASHSTKTPDLPRATEQTRVSWSKVRGV